MASFDAAQKAIGDARTAAEAAIKAADAAQKVIAATQEQAVKDALKDSTQQAVARGLFGAPTFFVGERMHFGQDRLPYVEELLRD